MVPAEGKFIAVTVGVLVAVAVEDPVVTALQQREVAFDSIRRNCLAIGRSCDVLLSSVVDTVVTGEVSADPVVDRGRHSARQ